MTFSNPQENGTVKRHSVESKRVKKGTFFNAKLMLSVAFFHNAECSFTECHFTECRGAKSGPHKIRNFVKKENLGPVNYKTFYCCNLKEHFKKCKQLFEYNIYSYLQTSGGQSSDLYLNVVHFFNISVN